MQADPLAEFEARAAEAERRLAELEKNGVRRDEKNEKEASDQPSELQKAEYRIMILLRALNARDESLKKAEDEVAKLEYQILHLKRALDRENVYGATKQ